jgi:hypothetical protein
MASPGAHCGRRILGEDRAHQSQRDGDDHGDDGADQGRAPEKVSN